MDPGSAFGLQDHHILAYVLSGTMGIIGILMLALLITLMQDGFDKTMEKIRKGNNAVMESGHIVVIGFTPSTIPLLQELCNAHKRSDLRHVAAHTSKTIMLLPMEDDSLDDRDT